MVIENTHDEMIVIPNNNKDVFVVTYDVNEHEGTFGTKVINSSGETIITGFDMIAAIDNFDSRGNIWHEDNVLLVRNNEQYGLVNFDGDEILAPQYDGITALRGTTLNFIVSNNSQVGLANENGQFIIPIQYTEILSLREGRQTKYVVVNAERK